MAGCAAGTATRAAAGTRRLIWILIAVVLAAAVGPLLWLLPSRRQRQLGAWRTAAREHGLVVELASVEVADVPPEERVSASGVPRPAQRRCVAYRLPLVPPLDAAPRWRLLKSARTSGELPGWSVATPPPRLPMPAADYWRRLRPLLDALPGGCVGVEATAGAVSWLGLETAEDDAIATAVGGVHAGLAAIAELHRQLATAPPP